MGTGWVRYLLHRLLHAPPALLVVVDAPVRASPSIPHAAAHRGVLLQQLVKRRRQLRLGQEARVQLGAAAAGAVIQQLQQRMLEVGGGTNEGYAASLWAARQAARRLG